MDTKLILQAAITFLVLSIGSGALPVGMSLAEAFQTSTQPPAQHAAERTVPEDFIFATGYTWLGRD
ncbi:MAG TPA: hypothetical protein VEG36_07355 [Burkholderiales bacterium]|nr:hypothetical protein [Burkholderiales bacterium]